MGLAVVQPDLCEEVIAPVQEIPSDILEESKKIRESKKQYALALDTSQRVSEVLNNPRNLTNEEKRERSPEDEIAIPRGDLIEDITTFLEANFNVDP